MTLDLTSPPPRDLTNVARLFYPKYTGPASYATGGDAGMAAALGITRVFAVVGAIISNGTLIYLGYWNIATNKLMWFDMAGAEVAAAVDLSTFTGRLVVFGQ